MKARQLMKRARVVDAIVGLGGTMATAAELNVGDPAPPFALTGSDGETYTLEQFVGERAVVVAWFPKAFTGG